MADSADTLLTILERLLQFQKEQSDALLLVAERQKEANLALAQAIGESTQRLEQSIAAHAQYMAQILERIVNTTDRTEQMTQRLLMQFGTRQQ